MAADPLQKTEPGTPLMEAVTADVLNALKENARHVRDTRTPGPSAGKGGGNGFASGLIVLIRNDAGDDLASGSILIVASTPLDPVGTPLTFMQRPALNAALPTGETGQVVILREPILDGKYGRATIAGIAVCDVLINSSSHEWARPIAADATKMTSATSGPARIIWKEGSSGTRRCVVNLLDGSGSTPKTTIEVGTVCIEKTEGVVTSVTKKTYMIRIPDEDIVSGPTCADAADAECCPVVDCVYCGDLVIPGFLYMYFLEVSSCAELAAYDPVEMAQLDCEWFPEGGEITLNGHSLYLSLNTTGPDPVLAVEHDPGVGCFGPFTLTNYTGTIVSCNPVRFEFEVTTPIGLCNCPDGPSTFKVVIEE